MLESIDGALLTPGSPEYDAARRPENRAYADVRPALVLRCGSEADVVRGLMFAQETGLPVVARGGGHCFAGRSSTEGLLLDLSPLATVDVDDEGVARIGAGARLGRMYAELHRAGRTLPAGCGETVGIAGLTLGGGFGLLGRRYGLTCDRLVAARVVLADGRVVECDDAREPDLFWALRGAGGGQFGVVTSLTFATVPEPVTTRFELRWGSAAAADVVATWQRWAPYAPDELTANLTLVAEPGRADLEVIAFGASMFDEPQTRELLDLLPVPSSADVRSGLEYSELKLTFADLDPREDNETRTRIRSELFTGPLDPATVDSLLARVHDRPVDEHRQLTFLALGGAYSRVAADATAYAHRAARFNLEHVGPASGPWVDRSWEVAHADGSGGVYANFPDPALATGPRPTTAPTTAAWLASSAPTTPTGSSTSRNASNPTPRRTRDHSAVHVDVPGRLHRRPGRPGGPGARPQRRPALQLARRTQRPRHQRAGVRRGLVDRRHHLRPANLRARRALEGRPPRRRTDPGAHPAPRRGRAAARRHQVLRRRGRLRRGCPRASGGRPIMVHGAGAAQALLQAGELDEMEIHLVPVLLGAGRPLFGSSEPGRRLELVRRLDGNNATHLRYRVVGPR